MFGLKHADAENKGDFLVKLQVDKKMEVSNKGVGGNTLRRGYLTLHPAQQSIHDNERSGKRAILSHAFHRNSRLSSC